MAPCSCRNSSRYLVSNRSKTRRKETRRNGQERQTTASRIDLIKVHQSSQANRVRCFTTSRGRSNRAFLAISQYSVDNGARFRRFAPDYHSVGTAGVAPPGRLAVLDFKR